MLNKCIDSAASVKKLRIQIDDTHFYMIGKYGPTVQCISDEGITYLSVKDSVDVGKIERGELRLEDIVGGNGYLGKYQDQDLWLKSGKYGQYLEWGENKKAAKNARICGLEEAIRYIERPLTSGSVRDIDEWTSIRSGKFGHYIYRKMPGDKEPQFISLKEFRKGYLVCDVEELYDYIAEKSVAVDKSLAVDKVENKSRSGSGRGSGRGYKPMKKI